jgi:4-amino-4-deoxy-L-arabinose transferase-like glycosyltransferase
MTMRVMHAALLAAVLAGAFVIRYEGISFGLPLLVHPDEAAVAEPARRIAATGDLDPKTFLYPSLTIYAQALSFRARVALSDAASMTDRSETEIYRTGRALTVAFAVATVVATYAVARAIGGPWAGLAAAALTAVSELHVANSLPITTDVPMALFVVLACLLSLRIHTEGGRMRDYIAAGLCAGLATSTKYNGVFAVLPIAVAHFVTEPPSLRMLFDRRLLAAAAASVLGFVAATPYALVDSDSFLGFLRLQQEAYSLGHPGAEETSRSYGFYLNALRNRFGTAPLVVAGLGLALLARRSPRSAAILATFPAALFLFMGAYPVRFDRNIVSLVSFAAAAAGFALAAVVAGARASGLSPARRIGAWLVTAVVVGALGYGGVDQLVRSRSYTRLVTLPHTRWLAKVWIEENLPAGSRIAREFYTPPIDANRFEVAEVGYWGLIRTPEIEQYDFLIASSDDFGRFVNQPARYPEEASAYHRIFARYELVRTFAGDWRTSTGPEIRIYRRPAAPAETTRPAAQ